jgi:integrase
LYEPRPAYYVWRAPSGKVYALGSIPLAHAIHQAMQANAHILAEQPSLVERMTGADHTVSDLLDKMPAPAAQKSQATYRWLDGIIRREIGTLPCYSLTVAKVAAVVEAHAAKPRSAQAIRARLVHICRRGQQLGWLDANPAAVTQGPKVVVQRKRLTLDDFRAIYAAAPRVAPWLQRGMMLALVLGCDVSTLCGLTRSNVADGLLTYRRAKTGAWIAVPTVLRMDALNVSLADLVSARSAVISPYLVHHTTTQSQTRPGDRINPRTMSGAFTQAVRLAGITGDSPPTMHELRSLARRTYAAQGNVDVKALLGHSGEKVSELYGDPRGVEPVKVRVG